LTPRDDLRAGNAASALCIVPALRGGGASGLFATHPPLQQRLEQLARIQAELSRPAG
jgi:heat shock protein HtpX